MLKLHFFAFFCCVIKKVLYLYIVKQLKQNNMNLTNKKIEQFYSALVVLSIFALISTALTVFNQFITIF